MRSAERARKEKTERRGEQVGVKWHWQPCNTLPSGNLWERNNSEAESRDITLSLFADDTTVVGLRGEIEEGVREMKRVMESIEERNNKEKEETQERFDFGSE